MDQRKATKEICIRPETKELAKERKPEGVTWDRWLRRMMGVEE
jgi:hypothetical protein